MYIHVATMNWDRIFVYFFFMHICTPYIWFMIFGGMLPAKISTEMDMYVYLFFLEIKQISYVVWHQLTVCFSVFFFVHSIHIDFIVMCRLIKFQFEYWWWNLDAALTMPWLIDMDFYNAKKIVLFLRREGGGWFWNKTQKWVTNTVYKSVRIVVIRSLCMKWNDTIFALYAMVTYVTIVECVEWDLCSISHDPVFDDTRENPLFIIRHNQHSA